MRAAVVGGALLGVSLALHSETLRAQTTPPLALDWVAPPTCPTQGYVLAGVARILGRSTRAVQHPVTARAAVSRLSSSEWQVDLATRVGDAEGARSVRAPTCRAAADTTALILALAIDPDSRPEEPTPVAPPVAPAPPLPPGPTSSGPLPAAAAGSVSAGESSPIPAGPTVATQVRTGKAAAVSVEAPRPATPIAAPASPPSEAASFRPPLVGVSAAAAAGIGILPSPAVGVEGALSLRPKRFRLEAGAVYWIPQDSTLTATGSASFTLVSPFLRAGFAFERARWELVPYLAVDGYIMTVHSQGFSGPSSTTAPWIALGPDVVAGFRVTSAVALRLGAEASFPLGKPNFEVTGGPTAFRPSAISGRGTLGVEVRFL